MLGFGRNDAKQKISRVEKAKDVQFDQEDKITNSVPASIVESINYANRFDFPVGKPDAKGYYNAQIFGKNNHLGDDWNGANGGNSDLGEPIYAVVVVM